MNKLNVDRSALITGGASGLGLATVRALDQRGARIAVFDRDTKALEALSMELPHVSVRRVELTDLEAVDAAVEDLFASSSRIDALINNAGIIRSAPLIDVLQRQTRNQRMALWDEVIASNLSALFGLTMCVAEHMVSRRMKGVIVNVSSIAANGNPGQSAYSAAKAGVEALTRTWAKELGPLGIRANCVSPGFIDTPSTHTALGAERAAMLEGEVPMRRLGAASEVAMAIMHLIENDYANGAVLRVDGGLVI